MSFWRVTLNRSIRLGRTYLILGVAMTIYGAVLSNIFAFFPAGSVNTSSSPVDLSGIYPLISVAILSLSALISSLPVVMLFVYDKNNGVLEYLLSTGLDQLDIFKGYVKVSFSLSSFLLVFSSIIDTIIGILLGTSLVLQVTIIVLTFAIGISEVFLVTVSMIAFSSLQKTPMGANQPLGVVIGIIPMFPSLILPFIFPAYALFIDIAIATIIMLISLAVLFSINRLILRERFLP
jgi:hypothetical protein